MGGARKYSSHSWLNRWRVLGISMVSYSALSLGDCFGLYSSAVKAKFNLTQDQLDTIGTAPFLFNLVGFAMIPGWLNDRYGGEVTLVGAGLITGAGLLLFYAIFSPCTIRCPHRLVT